MLLPYCVSSLAEEIALFVLDHEAYFKRIIRQVLSERDKMLKAMQKITKIKVYPSEANFILFKSADATSCFRHLLDCGILIRNVENHGFLKGCLRVSVGSPEENKKFIEALRKF